MKLGMALASADSTLASTAAAGSQHLASVAWLEPELLEVEQLGASSLAMRWRELFGRTAPPRLGQEHIRRAIAYRLQELALGGLSRQAQIRLKAASHHLRKVNFSNRPISQPSIVKPGTRFVREWQGDMHEVQTLDSGEFVYRGKTYRSLTTVAVEITGTHQSGPRFFGLYRPRQGGSSVEATNGR